MAIDAEPALELPRIPEIPSVDVLGMAELKGFLDFSQGSPQSSTLAINLMQQIAPLLASMTCLLKILAVVEALKGTVESAFTKTGDLLDAIGELVPCFSALTPASIGITIKGILELVISYFLGFIEQLESLLRFQAAIDPGAGEGNPVLKGSLKQAKQNVDTAMDNLMLSLGAIKPLMEMTKSLGGVVGLELDLPDFSAISVDEDASRTIYDLRQTIETIQQVIQSLPG